VLPWIFAIARHTALDHYRKTRRVELRETQVDELPDCPAPEQEFLRETHEMDGMLADLPEAQREVLVMLKVSGMSLEEVALATSSSVGSVKQRAHRAYTKLRDILAVAGRKG
jgi:RNA polymerase sigma-70 factor (ECF subfamily)